MSDKRGNRCLVLLRTPPKPESHEESQPGAKPRLNHIEIAKALSADIASAEALLGRFSRSKSLSRHLITLASSLAAFFAQHRYDSIFATGEEIGFPLAALLKLTRWRGRLVVIVHNCQGRSRKLLEKIGPEPFHRLACVSRKQYDVLVNEMGFPADKVAWLPDTVDADYFSPLGVDRTADYSPYVFACGMENRDYDTLISAMSDIPTGLRILASGYMNADASGVAARGNALSGRLAVMQRVSFDEMRRLYASSSLVVVPVRPASYAAGVNGLLEGMAMGKAVVVTASPGIQEYLEGSPAVVVPPGDPAEMARAIRELLAAPERLEELGAKSRAHVSEKMSVDAYVATVTSWFGHET